MNAFLQISKMTANSFESKINNFLRKHNFSTEFAGLKEKLAKDMALGLEQRGASQQAMIKAGSADIKEIKNGEKVIVIDAGGTNFRSCLVEKSENDLTITDFQKTFMPATDRELNKSEFYNAIADNIERLKDKADKISFCFSYAIEITEKGDGKILKFSKEVKAPQAVGTYVGKELFSVLKERGWKNLQKITILNDTTALLLSACLEKNGNAAFILGTGMNSTYIINKQIIVTECGMFCKLPQSDFDIAVDKLSTAPRTSILEKMTSGAYLGKIAKEMLIAAAKEGLFSKEAARKITNTDEIKASDFDGFLFPEKENEKTSRLNRIFDTTPTEDRQKALFLIKKLIERTASLCSQAILVLIEESDKKEGVSIACNGSTVWKTPYLLEMIKDKLNKASTCPYEIIQIDDDITKGSFAAAFIQ